MKQTTSKIQAATAKLPMSVEPINNPEEDMRKAVDDLFLTLLGDASEDEIATELMLFLHRLLHQDSDVAIRDGLDWAIARCYHFTEDYQKSQKGYLRAQVNRAAA
jgi:hypothetical protein